MTALHTRDNSPASSQDEDEGAYMEPTAQSAWTRAAGLAHKLLLPIAQVRAALCLMDALYLVCGLEQSRAGPYVHVLFWVASNDD